MSFLFNFLFLAGVCLFSTEPLLAFLFIVSFLTCDLQWTTKAAPIGSGSQWSVNVLKRHFHSSQHFLTYWNMKLLHGSSISAKMVWLWLQLWEWFFRYHTFSFSFCKHLVSPKELWYLFHTVNIKQSKTLGIVFCRTFLS